MALNDAARSFVLRSFRSGDEDFPGMAAANQRARDAAGIEEVVTADGMARDYAHLVNCVLDRDLRIAERDGSIVGYVRVEWRDLEDGTRSFAMIAMLDPTSATTERYGTMLDWAETRLAEKAQAIPAAVRRPSTMRSFSFGPERALGAALESGGWSRDGRGYEMVRATLDDIPETPMPPGLDIRPVGLDPVSRRQVWDAATEAFADERGETVPTEEDWQNELADPLEDPSLWVIAFDGDEVAGGVQGRIDPAENAHHGRDRGVIAGVWTRRRWRRRGLARALLSRGLIQLRDRGMTSAYLGVDGLNPNQAMDLYTSLGFEVASTSYDWIKPLPRVPEPDDRSDEATT
jgi:mycothiol synthase